MSFIYIYIPSFLTLVVIHTWLFGRRNLFDLSKNKRVIKLSLFPFDIRRWTLFTIQKLLDNVYYFDHALNRDFGTEMYVLKPASDGKEKAFG